jgi:maltooligosyltrehalose trehalohydrolase
MHDFSVWAPAASRVMLHLPALDLREPMRRDGDGWWHGTVENAGHGCDYAFAVDGGQPRPDPRSAWQPYGVDGASRVFDASLHPWSDDAWPGRSALGAVFYELHVGTFTPEGTLDAAIERLDHLVDLGIDIVELLPLAAFAGERGWGYDGVDLYAVHRAYGGPAAFQRFVDAAHTRGLGVCLDVVYNHVGPAGNYLAEFGPYFTGIHHTPWGEAVNLDDAGSSEVRAWIIDNALRWFTDFHVDCLRLDAVHALVDTSARHIMAELADEVSLRAEKLGRPIGLVAESDMNDPTMIEPTSSGGRGMIAQWDDDVHHGLHALLTGERQAYYRDFGSTAVLARVLTRAFRHAGDYSSFRGKVWGRPIDPARHRGHRFVVAIQNHDQVGNRAVGDRLTASLGSARLAVGAALLLTSAYSPLLFMGEEWGATTPWQFFTDYQDHALGEAVRLGRRSEFAAYGWDAHDVPDPQDPATRDRSVLDWDERQRADGAEPAGKDGPGGAQSSGQRLDHSRLLRWYRDLIAMRRAEPDLRDDDLGAVAVDFGDTWLAVHRGSFDILVNLGPEPVLLPAPEGARIRLGWFTDPTTQPEVADGALLLNPDEVALVQNIPT